MSMVELQNVSRVYTGGEHELKALDQVSMISEEGKFAVILGPSGAGKRTLLNLSRSRPFGSPEEFSFGAFRNCPGIDQIRRAYDLCSRRKPADAGF